MFTLKWLESALATYDELKAAAELASGTGKKTKKTSKQQGLFKQIHKTLMLLRDNPKHPGLHCHPFTSIENPFDEKQKVFEAYAQNNTPGAYRVFWCYGPSKKEITIIAITPHP